MCAAMEELAQFSTLIDLIYQGATDPSQWDVILASIAGYLSAPKALLFTPLNLPSDSGYMFVHGASASFQAIWPQYADKDVWALSAVKNGKFLEGHIAFGEELVPQEEFLVSDVYKEYLSKYDIAHLLTSIIFGTDSGGSLPTVCAFFHGLQDRRFTEDHRQRLSLVLPHLSRALGVMQRLRDADLKVAASRAALDKLNHGVLLIGGEGEVVFANRTAVRILSEEDGLRLRRRNGARILDMLLAADGKAQQAILTALRKSVTPDLLATPHFSRSVAVPRPSGRPPYALHFSSLPPDNEFGTGSDTPRAIAFLTDAAQPVRVDADWLRSTYGLTAAEVRTAIILAEGETLEVISRRMHVSVNTLKTQLNNIYDKTGTHNRARLVRLLLSLSQAS